MKILRYVLLALILWNLPSIALFSVGPGLGSLLSYITIGLLAVYYLFETKTKPNWWIITISLLYFTISSFQYDGRAIVYILETIKYFIVVIGGYELVKRVSKEELFFILLLGTLSIAVEAFYFTSKFGRYSGFYLNPNEAGFVCIYGYALVYSLKNTSLKLVGQFVFTLMGLLTFSRTFIVIWIFLNIISLKISIKNIRILGIGILLFSTLIFIDQAVGLNNPRFDQLKKIVTNENISTNEINDDSRMETWALYYDKIIQSPVFGNGYRTFAGETGQIVGVHNTYLRIIGEAGIIPLLLFLLYFTYLFHWSVYFFKEKPYLLMQVISLSLFLLSNHNFFDYYYLTLTAMWIQYQIKEQILNEDKSRNEIVEIEI